MVSYRLAEVPSLSLVTGQRRGNAIYNIRQYQKTSILSLPQDRNDIVESASCSSFRANWPAGLSSRSSTASVSRSPSSSTIVSQSRSVSRADLPSHSRSVSPATSVSCSESATETSSGHGSDSDSDSESDIEPDTRVWVTNGHKAWLSHAIDPKTGERLYVDVDDAPFVPAEPCHPSAHSPSEGPNSEHSVSASSKPNLPVMPNAISSSPSDSRQSTPETGSETDSDSDGEEEVDAPTVKRPHSSKRYEPYPRVQTLYVAGYPPKKPGRSRNPQVLAPAEFELVKRQVFAAQDTMCPVKDCTYMQSSWRAPDMRRHMETHRSGFNHEKWVCCGVPLSDAARYGIKDLQAAYDFKGHKMIGGCLKGFSRRDALTRHVKNKKAPCVAEDGLKFLLEVVKGMS